MSAVSKKVEAGSNGDLVLTLDEKDLRVLGLRLLFSKT